MKRLIRRLIVIAENSEDLEIRDNILHELRDIINEFATTYNCPSDWRDIGAELSEEYRNNPYIYEVLSLWDYSEN